MGGQKRTVAVVNEVSAVLEVVKLSSGKGKEKEVATKTMISKKNRNEHDVLGS